MKTIRKNINHIGLIDNYKEYVIIKMIIQKNLNRIIQMDNYEDYIIIKMVNYRGI